MSRLVKNLLFLLMAILLVMATAHAQEDTPTENCLPKGVTCQPTIGFDNPESAGESVEYRYAFEQLIRWFEEDGQQSHRGSKQAAKQRVASGLLTVVKFRRQSCEMAARVSVDAGTHERLPDLRFAISGGRIRAVCLGADESTGSSAASLNLQRGLLSMLQTSARDFHLPKSLVETDILGDCATHFVATGPNSFRKTKQLQECRGVNRFATVGPRISSWFSGVSPDSSRRLVTGHQQCDTSLHPIHGSINVVNCSEKLSLTSPLPASFGSTVKLEIRTSLRLIDRRSASVQPSTMLSKISRRTSLSYENDDELDAESPRDDVESLQSVLTSLCNQSKVRNPAVLVMNLGKLVSKVRYPEPLELLHRWLTTSLKCSNLRLARWQYLKTLVQADMDAGIVAIFRLLADKSIGGGLPIVGPDRQNILKILAIQAASSKFPLSTAVIISAVDFFKTCLTSSNSKASCSPEDVGPAMLAVSAVARRTKAAERSAELESSLTTLLTGFSEGDDKINGKNQRHLTDWALLAIGNLGPDWATQAVTSVAASTVEAARHSTGRRLLAVAALQNMQPSALAVSALERLLMSGALISSSDGRRLQAAIVRALLPRLEKGTCPTNRNCPTSLSTAIERLWNSSNPADAALATYAHSVARKRLEKLESSLSQDSALKSDAALRQLRQLVEKPPALFSIDRASKPSVRADRFQLVDGLIDISYEIDWESADAVIISMPTRAEFQLTLHNQMTGFAVPLLDAELIRRFSNGPGDHTAVIRRRGDVTVAVDWTGESSIGDLQRLLWDDTWMSATIESVLMPTTLQVTTSLGQALLISSEAALIANSGVSRRPPSVTESFRTDGSVMLQPSFSVYASRSVHLSGLSMGRRSSRSSVIHRLGISGDGDLSVELFWRWQTSDGWGLSVGLRSPLQRQELLRVRLMSVLAEGKNDAKNPVFNDTWISENQDDISSRQSWQLCMRAFSRTITGHNICASVKKQRQWSKFSLILERQDPKAELFEATLEKKTTETMSETKIVFGNRNSPQRHFGLTINSLNTSEGSFLKFDASNPVFPVSLNSSLQAGGGIAAAQLLAGSQSYSFLGNWSRNSSDWRLTGDVSRVDRSWQRFGLDLVSDAVSGTDQLTVRFPNGSRRINSLDGDFGSLTLARTLRLRASDFEAAVSARLTESGSNETASARFGISGGRVSNGSSDKLVFVQSTEARQLGVGWMRHRLETSVSRAGIENGLGTLNLSLGHRLELFTHSALGRSFSMLPSDVFSDRTDTINVSLAETRGEKWLALSGGGEIFSLVGTLGQRLEVPKALLNLSVSDAGSNFMSLCQARGALTILSSNSSRSTTVAASMGLIETADGVFRPAPLESFNLDVRFIRSPSGMRIYKETDGIAFNIKHYWPALTSLNQSLRLTIDTQRFREPKHSKNAIYFQQSLLHLPENRGLTHQISADGSLVPRNFSLTNQLSWLAYRRGFFKLVSLFELNGKCLFRMKQQVELAENYSASASTWWHRVGYALTVETSNNSHLLRSGGLKISTQAAVDDATVKAARQLVRADFVAIDRASANAVTAAFLRQLWQLLSTVRARQNMTFSLGNSLLASVQTDIDAVDLRLLHRHVLQKGWGSSQVLLDVRVLKLQRQVQATLEVAGRGELRAKLSNWPAERASVQFELRSYVSGRQGLLTADWNLSSRTASILIKPTSPTTGASAGNFNFSGAINLSVGSLRLLAEQPNIRARQRLEITWPKLGSMRLDFEKTSIDNRWGPDIHLAVERPSSGGRLTFLLNTSEPKIEQIGLAYRSSDVAEGYAATVRYVRYGHEFRADARGRGGVTFNGASNQLPLFNLTVEQALDLYGLEDAAPFSDIAKQLRLSAQLIATRRGEVDLAWWLTSPVSAFGLEPVVGMEVLTRWWPLHLRLGLATPVAHWRRCSAELRCQLSRQVALVSAALSGPSSDFVALYEHEFDEALTNLKARVHYQNNLLILTFEPQLLNASVAAVLAGSGETNLRGFIKTSWRSLQQLEFVATPAATYIDRIAHGESLRIFDARRISNRNFDPKGYIRRRDDWVLGIAFGVNSIEAFVANASVGLTSGGGIDDSDFELTLSGATAGMDLLSGRIYRQTSNGSSENPVISSGLRVICPAVTLNATEEATVGENGRKRWRLFLNDGGDVVTADVRFRGTRLDPDPTAQSSVIIRGTKYSVQQPDGPSSLRITASGFAPVDFNWSVQATSLARFRFRLNSQHRAKSSSETTVGTLDVEADWPSRIRAVFGRGANLASVKLGISTSSLSLIHSANGSFDGRVPLAPGLALRLPTPPGPVNLTAVWTPDDWLSNGLLNLDFWSSWRFRHRHRVVLSAAASEAQIETVSNSWRIFCNHSTASRTVQIFGSSNGFGDVDITQNSLKVSLADSADKLDMLYPNLFQFPWNNQDNVKSLKFAANLTAPTLSLLRPASLNIVRMVALDSQLKVRNVSLVCTYQADGGLQQADVTIAKAVTKSQGSKLIGTVMTKGFKLIQALHYEAEVNWKSANGEATAGVVCREQAKQLLAVQVSASKTGIAEFNAETSTNQSACRGRVVLPYLMKSRAPLLHFSMTDQVRIAFNASSDVKNWQFECYTMIRHFKVSRTTIDGVSKWHLTPDFRRTSGVVLSNSPSNGTTELRLPWRTIRLVQRRLTANLWELMLWPDAINRPFDANKLRCLTVSGSSLNYTIELTSRYLASPGLVVSLSSNATRMQLLVALTRAIRLDLKASLLQEVSLKRLQIFASLITPDATSRMEAGADLPAKMERIGPVALRNGRMKILLGKSMSNDHRGGIAHQIEFELAPFQRFYFSIKDGPLLDLSFNQASGRLVWQLLTSRGGTGGNRTRSVKASAAARVLAVVDAANSDAQIEVSSGLLNRQHRIYWPTQVPALLFAVFNGTAAHAGALAVNSDSDSVKDARKIDLWFSESVPANVSFGFAGFHLSRNGSMELATSWRLPREPVFHVQLLSVINSRLIANLPSASALRQALAEGSRVALTGSGDALQYELFAWQARPDSDVTLAASDLTAGWNFIRQISSRDEFYLKSVATPLLSRFGGLSNRVWKFGWQRILTIRNQMRRFQLPQSRLPGSYSAPGWLQTALERLALRWRHAVSGHLGRLRRAWMRLRELDQRPAEARQDYSEAEYDIYWLQNFLTPDDSFEYSTAAQVMQNSLASMGSEAAARLHGILFAHLADYKRLYDWLDDMGYEVRRLMSMKLDPLPELDSELLALARLWLRTKRRSDIFQRLTGLDSNQVLSWQPRCLADCAELGGTGVAQFRAQIRARVPRLRPAEWRRLAGRLARFARVAMDAIDVAIATVNGADKATLETD